jgi:hypothetical protein
MIFFCVVPVVDIGQDDARASSIRGDDTGKEKGNERDGMAFGDDDGLAAVFLHQTALVGVDD